MDGVTGESSKECEKFRKDNKMCMRGGNQELFKDFKRSTEWDREITRYKKKWKKICRSKESKLSSKQQIGLTIK